MSNRFVPLSVVAQCHKQPLAAFVVRVKMMSPRQACGVAYKTYRMVRKEKRK
jgi:hypothetical protein